MAAWLILWFAVMGVYYLCAATLHIAVRLPRAVVFVVCLPAMPFIVAWRSRREHPVQSRVVFVVWSLLYAIFFVSLLAG